MNPQNIPVRIHHLIPVATEWGIGDDGYRDEKVYTASKEDLQQLVNLLSDEDWEIMDSWLCGPEATRPPHTDEYVTFTCYTMAILLAKEILKNRTTD